MVSADGRVHKFGNAPFCGHADLVSSYLGERATDVEVTPNGQGYWILLSHGYVDFKDCGMSAGDYLKYSHNNIVDLSDGEAAVSMSVLPDGSGYWVFTNRGRALAFGNAQFFGDMAGTPLNGEVLGSVATPDGKGYWMVASDGGIFSFGNAKFYGSTGAMKLNKPVMSMAPDPDGKGYWLVASDGGIFAFDAPFKGSMGSTPLNQPVTGMVPGSDGYMMVAADGGIFSFGSVPFHGSLGATPSSSAILAVSLYSSDPLFKVAQPDPPPPPPPPPPGPAPVYEWVDVQLDVTDPTNVTGGYGEGQSIPFSISGTQQRAFYSCFDSNLNSGASLGCRFAIYRYSDGGYEDSWMPDAFSASAGDGKFRILHLDPGTYYVEGDEYDSGGTFWGIIISDYRCVQYCG
jgi:hypothetical protein